MCSSEGVSRSAVAICSSCHRGVCNDHIAYTVRALTYGGSTCKECKEKKEEEEKEFMERVEKDQEEQRQREEEREKKDKEEKRRSVKKAWLILLGFVAVMIIIGIYG